MGKRRRRRVWSDDEKRMICGQTRVAGVSVSQVARRYDVNANLVFKWLREPRFADAMPPETQGDLRFLPVEIADAPAVIEHEREPRVSCSAEADARLEIDLAGGHRFRVIGPYDAEALSVLIRQLSS